MDHRADQVPVTLLIHILSNQQGLHSAVLVNEFGEVRLLGPRWCTPTFCYSTLQSLWMSNG
jgi:G3E family GTPase